MVDVDPNDYVLHLCSDEGDGDGDGDGDGHLAVSVSCPFAVRVPSTASLTLLFGLDVASPSCASTIPLLLFAQCRP